MKTHIIMKEYDCIICNKDIAMNSGINNTEYHDYNGSTYNYVNKDTFADLENFILSNKSDDGVEAIELLDIRTKRRIGKVISAKNYVGLIQMKDGTQIEILPKIYCPNNDNEKNIREIFLNMLRSFKNFPYKSFNMSSVNTGKMNLYEIFINMYVLEVRNLVKKGLKSDYIAHEGNENFFKGKLLFNEHIKHNIAHKERNYIKYDVFNVNRAENRLIKTTLLKLLGMTESSKNKVEIGQLLTCFENIDISYNYAKDFSQIKINRNNIEYDIVLKWSDIFLRNKSFITFSGEESARALLFSMDKVFESYIAQQLRKKLYDYDCVFKTQDKGFYLFDMPKKFLLKPDIVIEINNKTFILDTKWKLLDENTNNYGISQSDMYQMYAYAKKYNADEVFLVYPKSEKAGSLADDSMKYISFDGVNVSVVFVDLDDIDKSLARLIEKIC